MRFSGTKGTFAVVATAAALLVPTTALAPSASSATSASTTAAVETVRTAASYAPRWVKNDRARVTATRSFASRVVARPDDGTRLRVVDRTPNRFHVRLPNGKVGWISRSATTGTPLADLSGVRFTKRKVAVRQDPWASSRVVAQVHLGTRVTRLARTSTAGPDKVKVRLPNGRSGWLPGGNLVVRNVWGALGQCESGGNYRINSGNGYYGLYQFTSGTWRSVGGSGLPHRNSAAEQTKRAQILQDRAGWGQWPACTRKLGLR